jgi:hypothetical protein
VLVKRELEALERQPLLRAIYALPLLRRLRAAGPGAAGPEAAGPEAVGGSEEREPEPANARAHLPQARDELVMRELAAASSHYYVLCVRPNDDAPDAPDAAAGGGAGTAAGGGAGTAAGGGAGTAAGGGAHGAWDGECVLRQLRAHAAVDLALRDARCLPMLLPYAALAWG